MYKPLVCVYIYVYICTHIQGAGWSGDRILLEARLSAPFQTGPGAHTAFYRKGTVSFPRVNGPGRGADHSPHLVSRLKKE